MLTMVCSFTIPITLAETIIRLDVAYQSLTASCLESCHHPMKSQTSWDSCCCCYLDREVATLGFRMVILWFDVDYVVCLMEVKDLCGTARSSHLLLQGRCGL